MGTGGETTPSGGQVPKKEGLGSPHGLPCCHHEQFLPSYFLSNCLETWSVASTTTVRTEIQESSSSLALGPTPSLLCCPVWATPFRSIHSRALSPLLDPGQNRGQRGSRRNITCDQVAVGKGARQWPEGTLQPLGGWPGPLLQDDRGSGPHHIGL